MKALVLEQIENKTLAAVKETTLPALADGDVLVDIDWSSLNYKDALAITGKGKIIRQFPMVPGIDFSGIVSESRDPRFVSGQAVILTGWGVGENHWGGLAAQACVKGDWLVSLPTALTARNAMIIGTAGFTAMLCVDALIDEGVKPESGKVLAQTQYRGCVAACGLAGGFDLPTTVMPFILRNVRLQGVDSVMVPTTERGAVWERLASILPESYYQQASTEIGLEQAPAFAADFLNNKIQGRTLVKIRG